MANEVTVYNSDGDPIGIRVTSDDGRSSVLHEYDGSILANLTGNHHGAATEWADHNPDGTTKAYEYDSGILANLTSDHRGDAK